MEQAFRRGRTKAALRAVLREAVLLARPVRRLRDSRDALTEERNRLAAQLAEARAASVPSADSPFMHYNSCFDPQEVVRRHAAPDLHPTPGFLTNYLGVVIDPKFFPTILPGREGEIEGAPIPANWHADVSEFGAALRAVDLARGSFTVIELGCGWGCWLWNTGLAARRLGLGLHLIGVEGDDGHLGFAREAHASNGFALEDVTLHRGIAGPASGLALFPRQPEAGVSWGLEPILRATDEQRRAAAQSGGFDELPVIALDEIAAPHPRIDLLHIDIQGGEADFIAACLPTMRLKVAYLLVGTHSRPIEGRIMETLLQAGWRLEIERPAIIGLQGVRPQIVVDGVQGWRNPELLPV